MADTRAVTRTKLQRRADDFDRDLFRLCTRAAGFACKDQTYTESDRTEWQRLADQIMYRTRPLVRAMMHPDDRNVT